MGGEKEVRKGGRGKQLPPLFSFFALCPPPLIPCGPLASPSAPARCLSIMWARGQGLLLLIREIIRRRERFHEGRGRRDDARHEREMRSDAAKFLTRRPSLLALSLPFFRLLFSPDSGSKDALFPELSLCAALASVVESFLWELDTRLPRALRALNCDSVFFPPSDGEKKLSFCFFFRSP